MVLTGRVLLLLWLGALLLSLGALNRAFLWGGLVYLLVLFALIFTDYRLIPPPKMLACRRLLDPKLSLGADNLIQVEVTNRIGRTLLIETRDEPPLEFITRPLVVPITLPGNSRGYARYFTKPLRRGDYTFGDFNLRVRGPLGLAIRQMRYNGRYPIKVYPNLLEVRKYDLLARRGQVYEAGLKRTRFLGAGTEFDRLREYQSDDDFRRINWKATSRRNKPITMEFRTERNQNIMIVLDTGRMMATAVEPLLKLDYAINTALMLSYVATLRGDNVGLMSFSDQVNLFMEPKSGKAQFQRMLEALYRVENQLTEPDFRRAFTYLALKNKKRSLVVVFTDLVDADGSRSLVTYLSHLTPRHLPVAVTINDPNIVTAAALAPTTSKALYEKAVAQQLLDQRREVLETLSRHGVITLDVSAEQLTVSVINTYLELKAKTML